MKIKSSKLFKVIALFICFSLLFEQSGFAQIAGQLDISGQIVAFRNSFVQDKFRPLHLRYLQYDSKLNNFKMLLDKGNLKTLSDVFVEQSTKTLLDYFLVGVSLPNDAFWVNLRPDDQENIIDPLLAQTDIGKILLEADVQLKKDTARFTSPETPEGKDYWNRLYKKAGEVFGSQNVTIPTLTRPWIVPDEIIIREANDNAYIYKATLKVMLEEDYLKGSVIYNFEDERAKELNVYAAQILREKIIPKLSQEINISKRYAGLRQVYYSLILAQWFKQKFVHQNSLYSNLIDRRNLAGLTSKEAWSKTMYFQQYQKSFKNGEYNFKIPVSTAGGQVVRSYFSGGIMLGTGENSIASAIGRGGFVGGSRNIFKTMGERAGYFKALLLRGSTNPNNPADMVAEGIALSEVEAPTQASTITTQPATVIVDSRQISESTRVLDSVFNSTWGSATPVDTSEHLNILQNKAMVGPNARVPFRVPEVRKIKGGLNGNKVIRQRGTNQVVVDSVYWDALDSLGQLNILMHEAMADWLERNNTPAEDIPMMVEGLLKDMGGLASDQDKARESAHQGVIVDVAMEGEDKYKPKAAGVAKIESEKNKEFWVDQNGKPWFFIGVAKIGGEKNKEFWVDQNGKLWIFKENPYVNEGYRPIATMIYYKFLRKFFVRNMEAYDMEISDKQGKIRMGTIERVLLDKDAGEINWSELSEKEANQKFRELAVPNFKAQNNQGLVTLPGLTITQINQVLEEMVVDWLFSNQDGHMANFLIDKNGNIIGIDKEQVFKYFPNDRLDLSYLPNGAAFTPFFYYVLRRLALENKLSIELINGVLNKIESIPDAELEELIMPLAKEYVRAHPDRFKTPQDFIKAFLKRKHELRRDFQAFFNKVNAENVSIAKIEELINSQGIKEFKAKDLSLFSSQQQMGKFLTPTFDKSFFAKILQPAVMFIRTIFNRQTDINAQLSSMYELPTELLRRIQDAKGDSGVIIALIEDHFNQLVQRLTPEERRDLEKTKAKIINKIRGPPEKKTERLKTILRLLTSWIAILKEQKSDYHRLYLARDGGFFHLVDKALANLEGEPTNYDAGSSVYHLSRARMSGESSWYIYKKMQGIIGTAVSITPKDDIMQLYKNIRAEFKRALEEDATFKNMVSAIKEELLALGYDKKEKIVIVDTGFLGTIPLFIKNILEMGKEESELLDESGKEKIEIAIVQPSSISAFAKALLGFDVNMFTGKERKIVERLAAEFSTGNSIGGHLEAIEDHPIEFNEDNWRIEEVDASSKLRLFFEQIIAAQMVIAFYERTEATGGMPEEFKSILNTFVMKSDFMDLVSSDVTKYQEIGAKEVFVDYAKFEKMISSSIKKESRLIKHDFATLLPLFPLLVSFNFLTNILIPVTGLGFFAILKAAFSGFVNKLTLAIKNKMQLFANFIKGEIHAFLGKNDSVSIGKIVSAEGLEDQGDMEFGPSLRYFVRNGKVEIGDLSLQVKEAPDSWFKENGINGNGVILLQNGNLVIVMRKNIGSSAKDRALLHEFIAALSLSGGVTATQEDALIHHMADGKGLAPVSEESKEIFKRAKKGLVQLPLFGALIVATEEPESAPVVSKIGSVVTKQWKSSGFRQATQAGIVISSSVVFFLLGMALSTNPFFVIAAFLFGEIAGAYVAIKVGDRIGASADLLPNPLKHAIVIRGKAGTAEIHIRKNLSDLRNKEKTEKPYNAIYNEILLAIVQVAQAKEDKDPRFEGINSLTLEAHLLADNRPDRKKALPIEGLQKFISQLNVLGITVEEYNIGFSEKVNLRFASGIPDAWSKNKGGRFTVSISDAQVRQRLLQNIPTLAASWSNISGAAAQTVQKQDATGNYAQRIKINDEGEVLFDGQPLSALGGGVFNVVFALPDGKSVLRIRKKPGTKVNLDAWSFAQQKAISPQVRESGFIDNDQNGNFFMVTDKVEGSTLDKFGDLNAKQLEAVVVLFDRLLNPSGGLVRMMDLRPDQIILSGSESAGYRAWIVDADFVSLYEGTRENLAQSILSVISDPQDLPPWKRIDSQGVILSHLRSIASGKTLQTTPRLPETVGQGQKERIEKNMAEIRNIFPANLFNELLGSLKKEIDQFRSLNSGVAGIAKKIRGIENFDLVINPASGADINAGFSFGDNLVTLDRNNLFERRVIFAGIGLEESLRNQITGYLERKLVSGMHSSGAEVGFIEYVAELILMGADLKSFQVIVDQQISPELRMTQVKFNVEKRQLIHTHFTYTFKGNAEDSAVVEPLKLIISTMQGKNILVLSKAGSELSGENMWKKSIYNLKWGESNVMAVSDSAWDLPVARDITPREEVAQLGLSSTNRYGYAQVARTLHYYELSTAAPAVVARKPVQLELDFNSSAAEVAGFKIMTFTEMVNSGVNPEELIKELVDIELAAFGQNEVEGAVDKRAEFEKNMRWYSGRDRILIARDDSGILGLVVLVKMQTGEAYMMDLAVKPGRQFEQVGTRIMDQAREWCRQNKINTLVFSATVIERDGVAAAFGFYEKYFKRFGVELEEMNGSVNRRAMKFFKVKLPETVASLANVSLMPRNVSTLPDVVVRMAEAGAGIEFLNEQRAHQLADAINTKLGGQGLQSFFLDKVFVDGGEYEVETGIAQNGEVKVMRLGPLVFIVLNQPPEATDLAKRIRALKDQLKDLKLYKDNAANVFFVAPAYYHQVSSISPFARSVIGAMLANAQNFKGAVVFDVGAGDGLLARVALRLGAQRIVLIENDRVSLERGQFLLAEDEWAQNAQKTQRLAILPKDLTDPSLVDLLKGVQVGGKTSIALINIGSHYNEDGKKPNNTALNLVTELPEVSLIINGGHNKPVDEDLEMERDKDYPVFEEARVEATRILRKNGFNVTGDDGKMHEIVYITLIAKRASSAAQPVPLSEKVGGIDFRVLPIVAQPMINNQAIVGDTLRSRVSPIGVSFVQPDKEWQQIKSMLNAGIIPSVERIKKYIEVSCKVKDCQERMDGVLSGIADILRLEEERSTLTDATLKQILVLLESNSSVLQIELALAKIQVLPKEPILIK